MSRLKELRLHGFKSFAEPTHFVFQPGVTAVIGPNGSGKSNMADAIRWVLGEQSNRSLRTRRSDDVIFAGSESRKPIGLAEVTLTLDNHDRWLPVDFAEVTITRRSYRSADPEYLINGARARLRDVVELLAAGRLGANELVVVGQGTVDAALSLRPEERRQLFEEAAGVKSLQVRRNESLARLGRARENLTRISDVVRELRPQVRRLALQAEHQEAHDRLGQRARALIDEHHRRRGQALQAGLGEARRRAAAVAADLLAERGAQAAGREAVELAEARYWEAEAASRDAGAAWETARETVIRAEGRVEAAQERARQLEAQAEAVVADLAEVAARAGADDDEPSTAGADPDADRRRAQATAAETAWREAVQWARAADDALVGAEVALSTARNDMADGLAQASRWNELTAATTARRELLEADLAALVLEVAAAAAGTDELAEVARRAAATLAAAEERAAQATQTRDAAVGETTRSAAAVAELEERLASASRELVALEAEADTAPDVADRLRTHGFAGLPATWRELPDGLEQAVAAALGDVERTFWWRGDSPPRLDDVAGAVRLVRDGGTPPAGRDAALAAVHATETVAERVGDPAAPELLQRTVIAPRLEDLLSGWDRLPDGWAAVTLDGDLADARGVVILRGRLADADGPPPRAQQLAALRGRNDEIERALAAARERDQGAAEALSRATSAADATQAALDAARVTRRRADDEAAAAAGSHERLVTRHAAIASDLAALPAPPPAPQPMEGVAVIEDLAAAAERARTVRDEAAASREAARAAWTAAVSAADAQDAAAADGRAALARADERRRRAEQTQLRIATERAEIDHALQAVTAALVDARAAEEAAIGRRQAADEAREAARQALLDAERRLSGGAGRVAELDAAENQVVAETSRLEEALAGLDRERELSLASLPEPSDGGTSVEDEDPPPASLSDDELTEELRRTRRTLAQIGSVNPFAIEEHRELSARLGDLSTQETDLRSATASTEGLIAELDAQISTQFQAAFAAIGQRFDEYCQLLFGGGSASLDLSEDPDSEAPGGIEIAVRPPGKRLQRLAMLSGGERALAGVALLFAMLTVNPVPFCVLDEVDAALDEANIGRFADALRRLAETIDFVVITHNRATIEIADTIYGVTMTDAAVSRVLSLRLADLPVPEPV